MMKMQALRRFRLADGDALVWIEAGQEYTVASEDAAMFHELTGRGKRIKAKGK
ncbi:hypothetical protein ACLB6G_20345 [Zhengella sp. ZM62]|uniref:hypothetical protein n=1 Tax=Zhengella sedimenti TaxID=3390035 RepID=UPI003974E1F4